MIAAWLLLAQTSGSGTAYGLRAEDPALDRPLAIEASIEPLPALLTRVGKSLGLTLTVERRMEGLKATVLTPARPARLTLAGLASVFDATWTPLKGGRYRLEESVVLRNRREAHLETENAALVSAIRTEATSEDVPSTGISSGEKQGNGAAFRTMTSAFASETWRRLLDGEAMLRSVGTAGAGPRIVALAYDPDRALLQMGAVGRTGSGVWNASLAPDALTTTDTPFLVGLRAWTTKPESTPELALPLRDVPLVPSVWHAGERTTTDLLENLFRRSGVPIVAEANRVATTDPFAEGHTLGEALTGPGRPAGFVRIEAGTLLHRPAAFWRRRRLEPDEAALARLEGPTEPTMDEIATVFAGMPAPVVSALSSRVLRLDLDRMIRNVLPLRLWGGLSNEERARFRRNEAVPLSHLSPAMREKLTQAAARTLFLSGNVGVIGAKGGEDHGSQAAPILLSLLGESPGENSRESSGGGYSLFVQGNAGPPRRPAPLSDDGRGQFALSLLDAKERGLRVFVPR